MNHRRRIIEDGQQPVQLKLGLVAPAGSTMEFESPQLDLEYWRFRVLTEPGLAEKVWPDESSPFWSSTHPVAALAQLHLPELMAWMSVSAHPADLPGPTSPPMFTNDIVEVQPMTMPLNSLIFGVDYIYDSIANQVALEMAAAVDESIMQRLSRSAPEVSGNGYARGAPDESTDEA